MELKTQSSLWTCFLMLGLLSPLCQSVSVHFLSPKPLYVVQGDTLILRTEIDIRTKEVVPTVIWEYVPTHAKHPTRVKVAEYPEQSPSGRVTMEEQGAVLKITNFGPGDSGVYAINVTDHVGQVASAQHVVEEYLPVHHVSVMVNVSHTSLHCMEAWGTEPVFSWLHDNAKADGSLGQLSADNSTLYVTSRLCGQFTCVVRNKLGHCSASHNSEPCERKGIGGTVAVVCLFLLLISAGALLFLLWRRRQIYRTRGERLREAYDGPL
ncbi:peroxidasin-like protein isoform X1 [Clupea harengus]|uniref:Peroxidasin-like protein isoform X1 n=1 Tax=Clupea harengus TaxID=7950 RepID=A0A6P3VYN3_CLUHA|nr:peroxidasin-like protein isoform X1 [Clupea harengus]XP_031431683.1 peroxidasin-like protein isoform X1 [Clupea harengus]XP_042565007.1 peroxidasin-like protein isoform X1 [Clupea harengus]XP_042565008.1 peroxidasin-like protein isoform X1 [Clupea harengus]